MIPGRCVVYLAPSQASYISYYYFGWGGKQRVRWASGLVGTGATYS